ncbi:hypothetical protein OROGR_025252 [Orobanche gracilis]
MKRQLLPILKFLRAFTPELVLRMRNLFVYGLEQMSCWNIHVKRYYMFIYPFDYGFPAFLAFDLWDLQNFIPQATTLLQKNLENAKASLEVIIADLHFLRDQVTITQ